jgi:hypothetical protein
MTQWNRKDAETAIALKRAELNSALQHKSKYDPEGHNVCLALIRFKDGTLDVLAAYSHDSVIPESIRIGLNLIPNLYAALPDTKRFGCDGMPQFHTEPKLLNYLCAAPSIRQDALQAPLPKSPLYRSFLTHQRKEASTQAQMPSLDQRMSGRPGTGMKPKEIASITLVSEINCCRTCTKYSVERFRTQFPSIPLEVIELGKVVSTKEPAQFKAIKVTETDPRKSGTAPRPR